mmetsp:Transcript_19939/g.49636  ORF Transcript_19939/g.49636 Transcript_19939/m.49636 type:complete len:524 (+) Transcript_19939:291-1862(+)
MSSTQEVGDIFGQGKGSAQAMLRSPTVLILCIGLWGMNLFFYRLFGIDYRYVLKYDLIEIEAEELRRSGNGSNGNSTTPPASRPRRKRRDGFELTENHDLELMENNSSSSSSINININNINSTRRPLSPPIGKATRSISEESSQTDIGSSILWYKLVLFCVVLLFLLHTSTHYWMDHLKRSSIGAVGFFYLTMVVYIFVPLPQNIWLRRSFGILLRRSWALIHPRCSCITLYNTGIVPRRIPFVDVFFADFMCSLSKVFFDWGMLAHQAIHYPHPVPAATHNIVVPSFCAAMPYLIRARQCLIMFTVGKLSRDPHKHHHLMNAFKYSTSMYPLILSAYLKTLSAGTNTTTLNRILVVLMIVNSSYSLYWDIVMDWGMMQDPYKVAQTACAIGVPKGKGHSSVACHQVCLRPSLRFGLTLSALIVFADSILRFSWLLKFVPRLFPSHDAFVLCTQFLEVFRRAIWNLLRVEWENIKQQKKKLASNGSNGSSIDNELAPELIPALLDSKQSDPDDLKELELKPLR